MDICTITSIVSSDTLLTLDMLDLVYSVKTDQGGDPSGNPSNFIVASPSVIDDLLLKYPPNSISVDPEKLHWAPLYVTDPKKDQWTIASKVALIDKDKSKDKDKDKVVKEK